MFSRYLKIVNGRGRVPHLDLDNNVSAGLTFMCCNTRFIETRSGITLQTMGVAGPLGYPGSPGPPRTLFGNWTLWDSPLEPGPFGIPVEPGPVGIPLEPGPSGIPLWNLDHLGIPL